MNPAIQTALLNGQRFPTDGLVGYWTFDDVSGSIVPDHSRYGNTVTTVNSPTAVVGKYNSGLQFLRTSQQEASAANSPTLNITGSFTLACWVNITSVEVGFKYPMVFGKTTDYTGYQIYIDSGNSTISLLIGTGGNPWVESPKFSFTINTWYHIAFRYDRSTLSLWINGVSQGIPTSAINKDPATNAAPLYFGRHYSDPITYGRLDHIIDEARIYNRALTDYEMTTFIP